MVFQLSNGNAFGFFRAGELGTMRTMEIHFGIVRDKEGIYSGLLESRSRGRQLAVCYNSDGKLIVKICIVKRIHRRKEGGSVTLMSPDDGNSETTILIDHIQSIYPIRAFA